MAASFPRRSVLAPPLSRMSYRDDLAAAHARIAALEVELAQFKEECERLQERISELEPDAVFGREARDRRDIVALRKAEQSRRATEKEFEKQLRAKMKRWQEEAEDLVRRQLDDPKRDET
jgi:hypothetical protein